MANMELNELYLLCFLMSFTLCVTLADSNMCFKEATVFKQNPKELQEYRCNEYCRCNKNSSAPYHYPGCQGCCCEKRAIYIKKNKEIEQLKKQMIKQEQTIRESNGRNAELEREIKELKLNLSMLASCKSDSIGMDKDDTDIYEILTWVFVGALSVAVLCSLLYCSWMKFRRSDRWKTSFPFSRITKRVSFSGDFDVENPTYMQDETYSSTTDLTTSKEPDEEITHSQESTETKKTPQKDEELPSEGTSKSEETTKSKEMASLGETTSTEAAAIDKDTLTEVDTAKKSKDKPKPNLGPIPVPALDNRSGVPFVTPKTPTEISPTQESGEESREESKLLLTASNSKESTDEVPSLSNNLTDSSNKLTRARTSSLCSPVPPRDP